MKPIALIVALSSFGGNRGWFTPPLDGLERRQVKICGALPCCLVVDDC